MVLVILNIFLQASLNLHSCDLNNYILSEDNLSMIKNYERLDSELLVQDTNRLSNKNYNTTNTKSPKFLPKNIQNNIQNHGIELNKYINKDSRNLWVENAIKYMVSELDISTCENIHIKEYISEEHDYYKQYIKLDVENISKLIFEDGSYLIFNSQSVYNDREIGDITLAINENNLVYMNDGHVCGGLINFIDLNKNKIKSSHDFIRYFKSETENKGWVILRKAK